MWETQVWSLGGEDPLEKEMSTQPQYSYLENAMDRGAWWATVLRVTEDTTEPTKAVTFCPYLLKETGNFSPLFY